MSKLPSLELQGALKFDKSGHPFNGIPFAAIDQIMHNYQWYFNHFLAWEGPVATTGSEAGGWTLTVVETGAGAGRVDVDDSTTNGVLKMLTDAADNDNLILQMTGEPFKYQSGKDLWFFIKAQIADANVGESLFGLAITDTTPIAGLPSDGLFFEKAGTSTGYDFHARKNGTSTERTSINTMSDAVDRILGFHVESNGDIKVYDGLTIETLSEVASVNNGNANLPDDEDVSIILAVQANSAVAQSMSIDWVLS